MCTFYWTNQKIRKLQWAGYARWVIIRFPNVYQRQGGRKRAESSKLESSVNNTSDKFTNGKNASEKFEMLRSNSKVEKEWSLILIKTVLPWTAPFCNVNKMMQLLIVGMACLLAGRLRFKCDWWQRGLYYDSMSDTTLLSQIEVVIMDEHNTNHIFD